MCGAANAVTHSERVYPYPNLPYPVGSEYLVNEIVTEITRTLRASLVQANMINADGCS